MKMQTYVKSFFSIVSIIMVLGIGLQNVQADTRTGNLNVYVLIDRSLSMRQEIGAVQDYLEQHVCNNLLQSGDYVYALAFYGDTQHIFQGYIGSDVSTDTLLTMFNKLDADRHYTDIGTALDTLSEAMASSAAPKYENSYILLLSDNYHEGPPGSPYPGKTHNLDHPLLVPRKEMTMNDWKISILGITVEEKARRMAAEITAAWKQRN